MTKQLNDAGSIEELLQELEGITSPALTLVRVQLEGILQPRDRERLAKLGEILGSRFLFGALDTSGLIPAPEGDEWLASLPSGPVREAACRLRTVAGQSSVPWERATATEALLQLFALQEKAHA